ncbi:MAG: hypothetical protein UC384_01155 [Lachnospira sp.]|nr:hypothetical protein [Lachnospira sp.]
MFNVPEDCKDEKVIEIAIKLLKHVISNKKEGGLITYGELSKGLSFPMNPKNIEQQLGRISFACKENGLPPISVMVVNKYTFMPGAGFYKAYCSEVKGKERDKIAIELMNVVRNYAGWNDVLEVFENIK